MKAFLFMFNITANSFRLIISTCLIVGNVSAILYNLQVSFYCKISIYLIESEKKPSKNHFYTDISHQKDFLRKIDFFKLIFNLEANHKLYQIFKE